MAVVLLSSMCAMAHIEVGSVNIQPKVGLNISNLTDADNNKSKVGFVFGAEAEYQLTDILSFTGGLLYSEQGYKWEVDYHGKSLSEKWKPAYLNIPILANVYMVRGLAVKFGIQPGFMVAKDDADNAKSFDFSIPVGLSYEMNNVVLDARYNWGLTKVFDEEDPKNSVFQITLGYKFSL